MITISYVESSLLKYLHTNLNPLGIRVLEDIYSQDFDNLQKWVVIDSLSNPMGAEPIQHYFLHVSQHKNFPNPKKALNKLVDQVLSFVSYGVEIPIYNDETNALIGYMTICEPPTLSPVLQHRGGGSMRTIVMNIVYQGS